MYQEQHALQIETPREPLLPGKEDEDIPIHDKRKEETD